MLVKKRCEVCGVRFFSNNKTCGRKCGGILQKEKSRIWWAKNKTKVFHTKPVDKTL